MTRKSLVTRLYSIVCLAFFFVLMIDPMAALAYDTTELNGDDSVVWIETMDADDTSSPTINTDLDHGDPLVTVILGTTCTHNFSMGPGNVVGVWEKPGNMLFCDNRGVPRDDGGNVNEARCKAKVDGFRSKRGWVKSGNFCSKRKSMLEDTGNED